MLASVGSRVRPPFGSIGRKVSKGLPGSTFGERLGELCVDKEVTMEAMNSVVPTGCVSWVLREANKHEELMNSGVGALTTHNAVITSLLKTYGFLGRLENNIRSEQYLASLDCLRALGRPPDSYDSVEGLNSQDLAKAKHRGIFISGTAACL